jgi:hypothetical protein
MLCGTVYASSVAMRVANKGIPEDAEQALVAHTAACIRLHREGHELPAAEDRAFFAWLLTQAGMSFSAELLERHERFRTRRLERYGFT